MKTEAAPHGPWWQGKTSGLILPSFTGGMGQGRQACTKCSREPSGHQGEKLGTREGAVWELPKVCITYSEEYSRVEV